MPVMDPENNRRKILIVAVLLAVIVTAALLFSRGRHSMSRGPRSAWRRDSNANKQDSRARLPAPAPAAVPASSTSDSERSSASAHLRAELDHALGERDPRKRLMDFGSTLALLFKQDPEAALAYLRTMPQGQEYTQGLLMVLGVLGQSEPKRALMLAHDMATTREQRLAYSILFDQFARRDLPSALSYLALVPAGESRENALRALATIWADKDAASALNWAQHLDDATERAAALETTLLIQSAHDPRRTLELAEQFLSGGALDRILATSLNQLTSDD